MNHSCPREVRSLMVTDPSLVLAQQRVETIWRTRDQNHHWSVLIEVLRIWSQAQPVAPSRAKGSLRLVERTARSGTLRVLLPLLTLLH